MGSGMLWSMRRVDGSNHIDGVDRDVLGLVGPVSSRLPSGGDRDVDRDHGVYLDNAQIALREGRHGPAMDRGFRGLCPATKGRDGRPVGLVRHISRVGCGVQVRSGFHRNLDDPCEGRRVGFFSVACRRCRARRHILSFTSGVGGRSGTS